MIITHQQQQNLDIVKLSGRLVMADAPEARESFKTIIENGSGHLIIDLSGLLFVDTSGLSVLISAYKLVRAKNGHMALCGIPSNVQALLELTRLNEIFELFTSTDAALAAALGNT
jgi:anti-sigma B factor antagonist